MKPFNLERAPAGDPVVTRDGRKVSELHYFETATISQKLFCVIGGYAYSFHDDGIFHAPIAQCCLDLFMDYEE